MTFSFLKHEKSSRDIVIEVRGGCVQSIYSNSENNRVILIDWDNELLKQKDCEEGYLFLVDPLCSMPDEVKNAYKKAISQ